MFIEEVITCRATISLQPIKLCSQAIDNLERVVLFDSGSGGGSAIKFSDGVEPVRYFASLI